MSSVLYLQTNTIPTAKYNVYTQLQTASTNLDMCTMVSNVRGTVTLEW